MNEEENIKFIFLVDLSKFFRAVNTRLENIEAINRVAIGALFAGIGLAVLKVFFSQV